jgi:hypothetical protein
MEGIDIVHRYRIGLRALGLGGRHIGRRHVPLLSFDLAQSLAFEPAERDRGITGLTW